MKRDMMIGKKSRVKAVNMLALALATICLATTGCATYESSVPASTGIGAGAGALLGYGLTGNGLGAAAGAGAGALAGALTGVAIDETKRPRTPPAQSYHSYLEPQAYSDPTAGELFNDTPWRMEVFVDDSPYPVLLGSREVSPVNLDIGNHRLVANAYVSTRFGERLVGTYDCSMYVDPTASGWGLRFDEAMF